MIERIDPLLRLACCCVFALGVACDRPELEAIEELNGRLGELEEQAERDGEARREQTKALDDDLLELEWRRMGVELEAQNVRGLVTHARDAIEQVKAHLERIRVLALRGGTGRFKKGDKAPRGLTSTEIQQHATAQGDPHFGRISLDRALAGDPRLPDRSLGILVATFDTSHGGFDCTLREDDTPRTVANFVGLARGTRATMDRSTGTWAKRPLYDGTILHRVIDGFMIQGGDPEGTGRGDPGYVIEDEIVGGLRHVPGTLSMANRGPNTASSQFFIMVSSSPHLDGKHTIFGECETRVPNRIAKVDVDPRKQHRPIDPVVVHTVTISRK